MLKCGPAAINYWSEPEDLPGFRVYDDSVTDGKRLTMPQLQFLAASLVISKYVFNTAKTPELRVRAYKLYLKHRDRVVFGYLPYVIRIAKQFRNRGIVGLADRVQEGNIGLIRAVERLKISKYRTFPAYAGWWIKAAILAAFIEKAQTIRLSDAAYRTYMRLYHVSKEELGPDERAFIESLPITVSYWEESDDLEGEGSTNGIPSYPGEVQSSSDSFSEQDSEDSIINGIELRKKVIFFLKNMTFVEARFIRLRLGVGMSRIHSFTETFLNAQISRIEAHKIERKFQNLRASKEDV